MTTTLTKYVSDINGSYSYTYQCVVTENSYSVANNTSNVTIAFSIKGPYSPAFYDWNTWYGIVVDGEVKKSGNSSPYIGTSFVQLLSWTGDVAHDNSGSKDISIGVYLYQNSPSNYLPVQYKSTSPLSMGSFALTDIPRSSTITSASNVTLGNYCNIKWTPASTSFKYKIKFALGNWNYTTDYITPNTTSAFIYDQYVIPNNSSLLANITKDTGTMTATLYTYNSNNEQIGSSSSKSFIVTVPSDDIPIVGDITFTIHDYDYLLQGKNKIDVSVGSCSPSTGSSIKSYTFTCLSGSTTISSKKTTSTSATFGPFSKIGTLTFKVTVTDDRDRTAFNTNDIECYEYLSPSFQSFSAYRSDSEGTASDNGTFINVSYGLKYSSVNNINDVTVDIYCKEGSGVYETATILADDTSTSGTIILSSVGAIESIDANKMYTLYARVSDNYGGDAVSSTVNIFGESRIFNIYPDGTGIAFGKMAESSNLFECKWDAQFDGNITVNARTLLDWTHPIGSIYQSTDSTDPGTLFGGTWEKIDGKFLLAANDTYTAGSTGGAATVALTANHLPTNVGYLSPSDKVFTGTLNKKYLNANVLTEYSAAESDVGRGWTTVNGGEAYPATTAGGGTAHENMPPYIAVYTWKRIE